MKRTIASILDLAASSVPNRLAVTLGDESLSFIECERRANRTACALRSLGVVRGHRVMFWSAISLRNIDVYFALMKLDATFIPLNPDFSIEESAAMLDYIKPYLLIVDRVHAAQGERLAAKAEAGLAVVEGGGSPVPGVDLDVATARASDEAVADVGTDEEDIEAMFLTSGSTGRPKAVMVSHRASWLRANCLGASPAPACGGGGEACMFPLFHFAGWTMLLGAWAHRRAIHLTASADADVLLGMVERWRATFLYCIPAVWERILACPRSYDTSSLRSVNTGTSRVDPGLMVRLRARFPGTGNAIMYGSTEFGGGLALNHDDIARKPWSVGLPGPGNDARIVNGELCLRGHAMMSGYYALPEQTAEVIKDGWYHTGDLAEQDGEGYFTITGRRREIIRSGGETIAPAEVEAALTSFPGIREVAVVGLPDAHWGELVCAAIVLEPGATAPTPEALRGHVANSLAAFKHPRKVVVLDELPRTAATGQTQRAQIRDTLLNPDCR